MKKKLCVITGDGIGPEVVGVTVRVLKAALPDLEIVEAVAGWQVFEETNESVPEATFEALKECGAGLFGAVSSPSRAVHGYQSAILNLRQGLNLHANIRPVDSRWRDESSDKVNLVIVRENTEDLYVRDEVSDGEVAVAKRVITRKASTRIAKTATAVAERYGFSKINVVHKANVLPLTDGLFRDSVFEFIESYKEENGIELEIDQSLVDIAAYRLATTPEQFEVIVTTNMFGDILSDLAAAWCGGMGRAPSLNLGDGLALAEPVHGSAPDIAGKGIADPTATILSAVLLCRLFWNDNAAADRIESALFDARSEWPQFKAMATTEFANNVIENLEQIPT